MGIDDIVDPFGIVSGVSEAIFGKPEVPEAPEQYEATEVEEEETEVTTGDGEGDKGANKKRSTGRSSLMAGQGGPAAGTGLNV